MNAAFGARVGAALVLVSVLGQGGVATPASSQGDHSLCIFALGDTILTGSDVDHFDCRSGELALTPTGIQRWTRWSREEKHGDQVIPKLSKLSGREFDLELDGRAVAKGHFTSLVSSVIYDSLVIYDALIRPGDRTLRLSWGPWIKAENERTGQEGNEEMHIIRQWLKQAGKLVGNCADR